MSNELLERHSAQEQVPQIESLTDDEVRARFKAIITPLTNLSAAEQLECSNTDRKKEDHGYDEGHQRTVFTG